MVRTHDKVDILYQIKESNPWIEQIKLEYNYKIVAKPKHLTPMII